MSEQDENLPESPGKSKGLTEDRHRFWDIIIKAGTVIVAAFVGIIGLAQYIRESNNNIATQTIEREKLDIERHKINTELVKEQIQSLRDTQRTVAVISTSHDTNELEKTINKFWQLYWVDLIGVETLELESAMVQFGQLLEQYEILNRNLTEEQVSELRQRAYRVSSACSAQIEQIKKEYLLPFRRLKVASIENSNR
jgi:hypothetical protein